MGSLEKSLAEFSATQDKKVADAYKRNEVARRELEEMKSRFTREHQQDLNRRLTEKAKLEKMLEENGKMMTYVKKENKRSRKELVRVQMKHDEQKGRNDLLAGKNKEIADEIDHLREQEAKCIAKRDVLKKTLQTAKADHDKGHEDVSNQQDMYLDMGHGRLRLQKAMAKILTIIQEKSRDRSVIEETIVMALKAESMSKSVMAALDVSSLQPDLTYSDVSESTSDDYNNSFSDLCSTK